MISKLLLALLINMQSCVDCQDGWLSCYCITKSSVWFQGRNIEIREDELGVPQGGVLGPALFNALPQFKPNNTKHHILNNTEDIENNTFGYNDTSTILNLISETCEKSRLIISRDKDALPRWTVSHGTFN